MTPDPTPTWQILHDALITRRRVQIHYQGHDRVICPHVLGWKNNRPKVLAYQVAGTTSDGPLPEDPTRCWRSLFIDTINHAHIIDGPWQTAPNYTPITTTIDTIAIHH